MKFLKQVLAIAAGVFLAIFLAIYVLIAMASQGVKEARDNEQESRAEAEKNWNNMVKNGDHPGLIGKDRNKDQEEN